jgi:hypothetical protein
MSPEEFRDDLAKAREALEAACPLWAASWSAIAHPGGWAPRTCGRSRWLAEEGYAFDSSIKPDVLFAVAALTTNDLRTRSTSVSERMWSFPISTVGVAGRSSDRGGQTTFASCPMS